MTPRCTFFGVRAAVASWQNRSAATFFAASIRLFALKLDTNHHDRFAHRQHQEVFRELGWNLRRGKEEVNAQINTQVSHSRQEASSRQEIRQEKDSIRQKVQGRPKESDEKKEVRQKKLGGKHGRSGCLTDLRRNDSCGLDSHLTIATVTSIKKGPKCRSNFATAPCETMSPRPSV